MSLPKGSFFVHNSQQAEFVRSVFEAGDLIEDDRGQVSFVGRSNVGKSSLLNRLLGRKGLARISRTPGRTQAINYFLIDDSYYFVDLPGYGFAKTSRERREQWARLMEEYFDRALPGAMVVQLVDGKIAGTDLDREAYDYLVAKGADPVVVATKIDKVPRGRRAKTVAAVRKRLGLSPEHPVIECSAVSGEGVKSIWWEISAGLALAV